MYAHALAKVTGSAFNTVRQNWARLRELARAAAWTFEYQCRPAVDHDLLFPRGL